MKPIVVLVVMTAGALGAADLGQLGWISGCWETTLGPVQIEEQWTRPAGETMLGMGRTIKGGKTVFTEFLRIDRQGDALVYAARIGTKAVTPFKLVKQSETEVIFENPAHDFPRRIIYRKTAGGLFARIEGNDRGKARGEDFPYRRAACP